MTRFRFLPLILAAIVLPATPVLAQTKPAKKTTRTVQPVKPRTPDPDQSYLYLGPNASRSGGPDYVTQGFRESNQPYYNTGAWPDGTQPWSNR